jgi:DNA-binding transcriptional LysR family regulator
LRFGARQLALKILPVELPVAPRPVGIIRLKNRVLNPVAQLFIDCANGLAQQIADA